MNAEDVLGDGHLEYIIATVTERAYSHGHRLSKIEGLTDVDEHTLMEHYVEDAVDSIKRELGLALIRKIPEFKRLCPFCAGVLDCQKEHKAGAVGL